MDNLKEAAQKNIVIEEPQLGLLIEKKLASYVKTENIVGEYKFRIKGYDSAGTGEYVNQSIGNDAQSNIIGYFDKPDRNPGTKNLPCRLTAFNREMDKFKKLNLFFKDVINFLKN